MAAWSTGANDSRGGANHAAPPLSYSVKAPHAMAAIPSWQRESRVVITPDLCVIDHVHFYVRGRIVVPVRGCREPFLWGVWAQVTAKDFYRTHQQWTTAGREAEPPFMAKLATDLPLFGPTLGLWLVVHTQVVGRRPHFFVQSELHPLGKEQRCGIDLCRVEAIAATLRHGGTQALLTPTAATPPSYAQGRTSA